MNIIAELIDRVLKNLENEKVYGEIRENVKTLCKKFPFYSSIYQI
jgi:glycine/serine hydroxymethyltransferase